MSEQISPYIQKIKDWKTQDIIDNYLKALQVYKFFQQEFQNGRLQSFKDLRKICDLLWNAKEGNYLIFRRMTNPQKRKFEDAPKIIPNDDEIAFMNNVGLLFHKSLVARELKYILEYYDTDSVVYQETKTELTRILKQVQTLFKQGIDILLKILKYQNDNIPLLTYLLENQNSIENAMGTELQVVLENMLGKDNIDQAYFKVGKFYFESGWHKQAKSMLNKVLKINPQHQLAQEVLARFPETAG